MKSLSKPGAALPLLTLTLAIILIAIFTTTSRRYIYFAYQHLGSGLGLNLNNIATDQYVGWIKSQKDQFSRDQAIFLNNEIAQTSPTFYNQSVLGENAQVDDNKWIEIDLSEQKLYLKENGNTVNSFLVSTGKWAPTPQGQWRIWTKLRSTRMTGGSKALGTYYNLPNVPYTMYYHQGYGIHGAYWHNNFGQPMSHGCVNMKPEEAGIVFNWASVGTRVEVRE